MRLARSLLGRLSRSRTLARAIFGVRFPPAAPGERYFDLTTPLLAAVAGEHAPAGRRLLDMGTGLFATVGLAVWKRTGAEVVSCDRDPEIVRRAQEAVALNGAPLTVLQSDLFSAVEGRFDVVAFNPPYVPSAQLLDGERFVGQSDGGPGGTAVIERFLDELPARLGSGIALVGVSRRFVPAVRVQALCAARRLRYQGTRRSWVPSAEVHLIGL